MKVADIINHRLHNQQIAETKFTKPEEIVSCMIAMQSQEFAMAKWAIGLRLPGCSETDIDNAFNNGTILRTHLMRPTWHFITPADIRWLLALTAPRVHAINGFTYRQSGFQKSTFKRSNDAIAKALQGGKQLTRTELQSALAKVKIKVDGIPLSALVMAAELDGIMCSGPRVDKQFTYMLLDERVPKTKKFHRQEALVALTRRYFETRGPASIKDFANWSGLTIKDVKDGVAELPDEFICKNLDNQEYIFKERSFTTSTKLQKTFLLPDYDEYGMSYKDRSALFLPANKPELSKGGNAAYQHMIVINGTIGGTWKTAVTKKKFAVETNTYKPLTKTGELTLKKAVKKYSSFFGKELQDE